MPQAKLAYGVGKRCSLPTERVDGLMQPNCQQQGMGRGDCGCLHTREEIMGGGGGGGRVACIWIHCRKNVGVTLARLSCANLAKTWEALHGIPTPSPWPSPRRACAHSLHAQPERMVA